MNEIINEDGDMSAGYEIGLRLHSGVPVVDLRGDWKPTATEALGKMIEALSQAGHFEIIVNIQRAAMEGTFALQSLSQLARNIRAHCGHIDIVGTAAQVQELLRQQTEELFRLAESEEVALGRIKRMPVLTAGLRCTARPPSDDR